MNNNILDPRNNEIIRRRMLGIQPSRMYQPWNDNPLNNSWGNEQFNGFSNESLGNSLNGINTMQVLSENTGLSKRPYNPMQDPNINSNLNPNTLNNPVKDPVGGLKGAMGSTGMQMGMMGAGMINQFAKSKIDHEELKGKTSTALGVVDAGFDIANSLPGPHQPFTMAAQLGISGITALITRNRAKRWAEKKQDSIGAENYNPDTFSTGDFGVYAAYGGSVDGNYLGRKHVLEFVGPPHELGGINTDYNQDGHQESQVEGGEVVQGGYIYPVRTGYDKEGNPTDDPAKVKKSFSEKLKDKNKQYLGRTGEIDTFTKQLEINKIKSDSEQVREYIELMKQLNPEYYG